RLICWSRPASSPERNYLAQFSQFFCLMNTDYHLFFTMVDCPVSLNVSFMSTRPSTTLADFSRARDSQITFSVTHGWSAFWRGGPWLAGGRIGETSSDVGSSRFWIGWVTKHGDKCARSTCRD